MRNLLRAFIFGLTVRYMPGTFTYWVLRLMPLVGGILVGVLMWTVVR